MHKKCSTLRDHEAFFKCTMKVEKFGFYGLASYFIKDVESNPKIDKDFEVVNRMVNFIKEEFKKLLNEKKDFLDETTKKNYVKKIDGIVLYRGHHQSLKNTKLMEECYDYFKFSNTDSADVMMENIDRYELFVSSKDKKTQELCRHYIVDGKSDEAPLFLLVNENAFYDSVKNRFTINPMIFKDPFFDREFPMSLNYGSLGFVIGHELMHALDYYNINLDHEGNASINMTSNFSMDNYKKKSNCFLRQYNYRAKDVDNLEAEEIMRLKEDIADNGGLKIAFRAYKSYHKSIGKVTPKIPGFAKYTGDQMFFINYGRFFCKHFVVPDRKMKGNIGVHNPMYIRIRNTLGNFNEFSKEYKCNAGSKMIPKEKCELW
uniref:Peptidase_M13 domain-containing protein n=1 Tax=Strongyloides papillosus TaxID=174720 RepID=A0A0N5CF07_STREA